MFIEVCRSGFNQKNKTYTHDIYTHEIDYTINQETKKPHKRHKVNQEIPRAGSNSHSQAGETKGLCFLSLRTRLTWWKLKWDQKCPEEASDVEYLKPMSPNLSKGKMKGKKYLASIFSSLLIRSCLCLPLVKHWWRLSNRQMGKCSSTFVPILQKAGKWWRLHMRAGRHQDQHM